ncbi:MAG: YggT family protein [Chloroflexi bacterium]|nr:MAG: YggT family protein [Chloroflexota bacterium]
MCVECFAIAFARTFVDGLSLALTIAIFARVILSWVQLPLPAGLSRWIFDITEPILAPIRRAASGAMGGLDFSPAIALILLQLVHELLLRVLRVPF